MSYQFLEWLLLSLLGLTGILAGGVLLRELWRGLLWLRLQRRSRQLRELVAGYQNEQFKEVNKLVFQLKDARAPGVVEHILREFLQKGDQNTRENIREVYKSFDFRDNYRKDLESPRWRIRAETAYIMGLLGDPNVVPALIERLEDPDEDEQNVKMACAQALGMIRDPGAIPFLVEALKKVNQWSSVQVAEVLTQFGEMAVPELMEGLSNESSVNQRIWCAQILGSIGAERALSMFRRRLQDRDANVRIAVLEALGRLKSRQALHDIIRVLLHDPVANVRAQAATTVSVLKDEAALQPLINALNDPDYWTRLRAVEALEVLGSRCIPDLIRILFLDPRLEVRQRAGQALERLGVVDERLPQLLSENPSEALEAQRLMAEMTKLGHYQQIQGQLDHPDPRMRQEIVELFGEIGDAQLQAPLLKASQDEEWSVRVTAFKYLIRNQYQDILDSLRTSLLQAPQEPRRTLLNLLHQLNVTLLDQLRDVLAAFRQLEVPHIRRQTLLLAARLTDPPLAWFFEALDDPVDSVRKSGIAGLHQHPRREATPALLRLLQDPDHQVRTQASQALGALKDERAIDPLLDQLETAEDDKYRRSLAEALAGYGLDVFYERLDDLMGSNSLWVKLGICWVLGDTRDPRAIRLLSFFLEDTDAHVRCAAIGSLGRIPQPNASKALTRCLHDANARVRASAVNAFRRLGHPEGLQQLAPLLYDPDPFIRNRTALTLGQLCSEEWAMERLSQRFKELHDPEQRYYLLIGLGLHSEQSALQHVQPTFHQESMRERLLQLLDQEDEPHLKQRFLRHLHLETLAQDLDQEQLKKHYLAQLKQNQDIEQRHLALQALSQIGTEDLLHHLLDALSNDPEQTLRSHTAEALTQLGYAQPHMRQRIQEGLLESLQDPSREVTVKALEGLEKIGDRSITYNIFMLLDPALPELLEAASSLLISLYKHDASELIDLFAGFSPGEQQEQGIRLLKHVKDPKVIGFLCVQLQSPQQNIRLAAIDSLTPYLMAPRAQQAIIGALQDPDPEVRYVATRGMGTLHRVEFQDTVLQRASDPDPRIRIEVAKMLAIVPPEQSLTSLSRLAKDPRPQVRHEAFLSLASLQHVDAYRFLNEQIGQLSPLALDALKQSFRNHPITEQMRQLLRSEQDLQKRHQLLLLLAKIDEIGYQQVLLDALQDPAQQIRKDAVRLLLQLRDPRITKKLQVFRDDLDPEIRKMIEQAQRSPLSMT